MKNSKEKEQRISNLKDMINNATSNEISDYDEEIEEDIELINYLHDQDKYNDLEIDDEFIYHPGDETKNAINLEENPINNDFIIKTPKESENTDDLFEGDELFDDFTEELSENFESLVNAKVGRTPIIGIVSTILGLILMVIAAVIFSSRSDRIIDNVVSGETNFISVIFLIFGVLLLVYGIYKVVGFKNPLAKMATNIDSIENDKAENKPVKKEESGEKVIPKSNIPLDKESYKIGEFNIKDLKNKLKKPSQPKKPAPPTQEELDKIPPAREKPAEKKGLTTDEIEEIEYNQVVLENESIDDIFAEVEDIEDIPIISIDSEEKKEK